MYVRYAQMNYMEDPWSFKKKQAMPEERAIAQAASQ